MNLPQKSEPLVPDGYRLAFRACEPVGINGLQASARKFIMGKSRELALVPERANPDEPTALRVVGSVAGMFGRRRLFLGYLRPEIAIAIAESGGHSRLLPRLRYVGFDTEWVCIEFDILTPEAA